jgi:isoamylase
MNMYWDSLSFELPTVLGRHWSRAVDTAQTPPYDISYPGQEPAVPGNAYLVQGRSIVVLVN